MIRFAKVAFRKEIYSNPCGTPTILRFVCELFSLFKQMLPLLYIWSWKFLFALLKFIIYCHPVVRLYIVNTPKINSKFLWAVNEFKGQSVNASGDCVYSCLLGTFLCVIQGVPLATKPGISLIILPLMRILQRNLKRSCTYTNTHEQQPYCVGTLSQMTERSAERRVRQETSLLAGWRTAAPCRNN
jgi:hypothetical protein